MCTCLSVKHLTYGASVRPENAVDHVLSGQRRSKKIFGVFSKNVPLLRSSGVAVVFNRFRWPFFFIAKVVRMRIIILYSQYIVCFAEPQRNTQHVAGLRGAHTVCFWKGYIAGSGCAQGTDEEFALQYYARII